MKKKQSGFTIVELLIATTVFSLVMVICLAAFLRVGQLYYKGVYLARTQEVARNISDDVVNQIRLNGSAMGLHAGGTIGTHAVYYMCAGSKRYSFMSNNVVNSQTENISNNFGLVRDNITAGHCVSPLVEAPSNATKATELLGDKMRVVATGTGPLQSDINEICTAISGHTICTVRVHVDFGDNDLLVNPNIPANSFATPANAVAFGICSGPLQGSQFCATSDLQTAAYALL